jgi:hypothetical protein
MLEDANGFAVYWADNVGDNSKQVKPRIIIVPSYNIYEPYEPNEEITFLSEESYLLENVKHYYYYRVTKDNFYKISINKEGDVVESLYYNHNIGELPVTQLRGIKSTQDMGLLRCMGYEGDGKKITTNTFPQMKDDDTNNIGRYPLYMSYLSPALEWADELINQFSDLQAIKVTCNFPTPIMDEQPCQVCNGATEIIIRGTDGEPERRETCSACNGTGKSSNLSPYGIMYRNKDDDFNKANSTSGLPLVYVSPDVNIIKNSEEWVKTLHKYLENALSLIFISEAQSAAAKSIDKEGLLSMVDRMALNYFNRIYLKGLKFIYHLLYMKPADNINLVLPSTFAIKTEKQLLDELQVLRDTNAPVFLIKEIIKSITKIKFTGDETLDKSLDMTIIYDVLFPYTVNQITELKNQGAIDQEDIIKHTFIGQALESMIYEDTAKFMEMRYDEIAVKIDALLAPIIKSKKPVDIINPSGDTIV